MLPVKVVRSLVLGEAMKIPPHYHLDHHDHTISDADDELEHDCFEHDHHHHFPPNHNNNNNKTTKIKLKKSRKIPMLLFTPTKELITDTFRLASLARDLGMNFHPTPSLSHLIFSWPRHPLHSLSSPSSSTSSPFTPSSSSTSSATSSSNILNDAVPIPFPTLSTPSTSLSLLRFFVSLSKGLFKLVFFDLNPTSDSETDPDHYFSKYKYPFGRIEDSGREVALHSKVNGRKVRSMDGFAREMAGHGWGIFRTVEKGDKTASCGGVYLFRKKEVSRVKVVVGSGSGRGKIGNGNLGGGGCRVRELRLPTLDFESGVPLRVLLYIVLMAGDDVFYLA